MKRFELLIGLTAKKGKGYKKKLYDINKHNIKRIALFIEEIKPKKRKKLYKLLEKSCVKEIPLVHIRDDTTKDELKYLKNKYKTKYFTIHEHNFNNLKIWKNYYKNLYLEFNYDDYIPKKVNIDKIAGFCIDISHFKASMERFTKELIYIISKRNKNIFNCNHINGFDGKKLRDKHHIKSIKDFDYIKTVPNFIFGKTVALEMYNSIEDQLKYKKYLEKVLTKKLDK
ncbi:hypothetical protein GOV12_07120 [Candidatus Pacearchaeota archaeon]|nr:hypothetical protein [Candidatus Pacearchaeota archaeon]